MADVDSSGRSPASLRPVPSEKGDHARSPFPDAKKLARLQMLASHLRTVAALAPDDEDLRARVNAAGTACQQLVAYLRRQEGSR